MDRAIEMAIKVIKKYKTTSPFKIAKDKNIDILSSPLPSKTLALTVRNDGESTISSKR